MFLEYGINQHSAMVHISQVNSGIVDLTCPYCGVGLIARKGNIKVHHFAHNGDTCREVATRNDSAFTLPYYDKFDLGLSRDDFEHLKHVAKVEHDFKSIRSSRLRELEEKGFIRNNIFTRSVFSDWQLTHLGGIPFGRTTLNKFAEIQHEQLIMRHNELAETVSKAWKGKRHIWISGHIGDYIIEPQPEMIPAALADLNIYRAQLRRVLSAKLYFLEIEASGNTFYKVGVTSRDLPERIAEVERDLFSHSGKVNIKPLRTLVHRGSIEFYFKHRYAENRFTVGNLTEYFTFDNRKNVLSDLSKLGDYEPDEIELGIINSRPSAIEIEMLEEAENERKRIEIEARRAARQESIRKGMIQAREAGIHVGRPVETDILNKYPQVVEAIQQGIPLRQIVRDTGINRNTIRKVKAAMEGQQ